MTTTYTIRSIKGTETITGTARQAVRAALAHDEEYQPAYGTTIEVARGDVPGWEVLALDDAAELVADLRDEASDAGDDKMVELCRDALDCDDHSDGPMVAALAMVLDTAVEAVLAEAR